MDRYLRVLCLYAKRLVYTPGPVTNKPFFCSNLEVMRAAAAGGGFLHASNTIDSLGTPSSANKYHNPLVVLTEEDLPPLVNTSHQREVYQEVFTRGESSSQKSVQSLSRLPRRHLLLRLLRNPPFF